MKKETFKSILTKLSPILGAGAVGACPLCWIGSASLLTYLGLGSLVPLWKWLVLGLLTLSLIGFILDYRFHRNVYPLAFLIVGGVLLYAGRYIYGGPGFDGWPIWGPGAVLVLIAVFYNKKVFKKPKKVKVHDH